MLKRLVPLLLAAAILPCVVVLVWQPQALKKRLLDQVSRKMAQSTPYEFTVGAVSGNLLAGYAFEDVRLLAKSDHSERLRAKSVDIRIGLWPLLVHKTIQIDRLEVDFGAGQASARGRLTMSPVPSGQFVITDHDLRLEKILAAAQPIPSALHLTHTGEWSVSLDSRTVTVDMRGRLSEGLMVLHGIWEPGGSYRLRASWKDLPLDELWRDPALNSAVLSAQVDVRGDGMNLNGTGDAMIVRKNGRGNSPTQIRSGTTWAQANVRFVHGLGTIKGVLAKAEAKANIQGEVDLIHRTAQGRGTAAKITWHEKRLGRIEVSVEISERRQRLDAALDGLQFQNNMEKPVDITSARLSLLGLSPRWHSAAFVRFRNGSSVDAAGVLIEESPSWRFVWERLVAVFPSGGTWTARPPGSVSWRPEGRMELRNLMLTNGPQSLQVPLAVLEKDFCRVELSARQVDPAPWLKLFDPDLLIAGSLNASARIHGPWTHPEVDGFLNGKIQELTVAAAGLEVREIDLDLRSSKRRVEIRRLSGKTKKGDIQVSGASRLPDLDYALHARDLTVKLKSNPQTNGTGDADIRLGGTLESPSVTGRIVIKEATYAVPPKEKIVVSTGAAPAAAAPAEHNGDTFWRRTALDVSAEWPRNGWYRDGITSIETQASLRLQKSRGNTDILLMGTIRSVRGSYNYYGRDFNIESGEIRYTGAADMNPLLNIEASYRSDPTIVYLDITGTADKPTLKMRSSPPLSEQDIVSVIVFGQPLNELRSRTGGSSADQRAMVAAGGVLGSYIAKGLRQTGLPELNFDVLNIQPTPQGNQLTLGRYLSRRLFISYGQTLRGSAEKSITADYFLTDKWTLQGTSDSLEGNYMDLLFRYPLNKRGVEASSPRLPASPFRNSLDQPSLLQPLGPSR